MSFPPSHQESSGGKDQISHTHTRHALITQRENTQGFTPDGCADLDKKMSEKVAGN